MAKKALAGKLHIEPHVLDGILDELTTRFAGRGVTLIRTETEVSLAVAPAVSSVIESAYIEDKEVGDAGLEVLAIILYRGASTKSRIDYIRGVNTSSTIRTLLARGLIERTSNPSDSREYLYRPTTELLAHLGLTRVEDLPNYDKIAATLTDFSTGSGSASGGEEPFNDSHGRNTDGHHTHPDDLAGGDQASA